MLSHAANELVWLALYLALSAVLGIFALPVCLALMALAFFVAWAWLLAGRLSTRLDAPRLREPAIPEFEQRTCTSHDGLVLSYAVSRPRAPDGAPAAAAAGVEPRKCVLLCEPLGQSGPLVFAPLLATLGPEYVFVTWDYRGFFKSALPQRKRRISISAHADDAATVLRAAGFSRASICVGHSLGVQVALELTLLWPERVERLVLLNGCAGQAFQTAFQPVVRLPLIGTATREFVRALQRRPERFYAAQPLLAPLLRHVISPVFCALFGSPLLRRVLGPNYLYAFWRDYMAGLDASRGPHNLEHFLLSFLEIDAHSAAHLLDKIDQPALVISGMLDLLVPALVSAEMVARMRRAEHRCDPLSTHSTLLESPEWALHHIHRFLARTSSLDLDVASQMQRKSL